jgi:hypothetical protein
MHAFHACSIAPIHPVSFLRKRGVRIKTFYDLINKRPSLHKIIEQRVLPGCVIHACSTRNAKLHGYEFWVLSWEVLEASDLFAHVAFVQDRPFRFILRYFGVYGDSVEVMRSIEAAVKTVHLPVVRIVPIRRGIRSLGEALKEGCYLWRYIVVRHSRPFYHATTSFFGRTKKATTAAR